MRKSLKRPIRTEKRQKTFLIKNIQIEAWNKFKVQKAVDGYTNIEELFHDIIRYYGNGQLTLRRGIAKTTSLT